jgi:hypothetical protein
VEAEMSGRTTLGFVLLFLILGGYVYFFEFSSDDDHPPVKDISLYASSYGEFDIIALQIEAAPGATHFVRTDNTLSQAWQMLTPQPLPPDELDQVRVNGAAVRLGQLRASQVITNVTNLAQYGLASPALTVTLTISDGEKITLLTGSETPVNNSRYVQQPVARQTVYLVSDLAINELHHLLTLPPLAPTPFPTTPAP